MIDAITPTTDAATALRAVARHIVVAHDPSVFANLHSDAEADPMWIAALSEAARSLVVCRCGCAVWRCDECTVGRYTGAIHSACWLCAECVGNGRAD